MLFCCDISIFSIAFIARFGENTARDALFTFHSQLQRIHLNWPDISDIHFEKFLFYWLFFSWARFNFFPFTLSRLKAVEVTFISIYFDRISNWIAIKKVGVRKNLRGNLQWDHFRYIFFFLRTKTWCFCGLNRTSRVVNGWLNAITNGKSLLNWIDKTKTRIRSNPRVRSAQSWIFLSVIPNCIQLKDINRLWLLYTLKTNGILNANGASVLHRIPVNWSYTLQWQYQNELQAIWTNWWWWR